MANQNVTQLVQQTGSAALTSLFYAVTTGSQDTGLPLSVFVNNLGLTGISTVPTAAVNTNTTQIASCAYVINQGYLTTATAATTYAPIASPTFTGTATIPTAVVTTVTLSGGTINGTTIGATTPSSGSFTTLAASTSVSGAGFTGFMAAPPAIGSTTASTGAFTTLSSTGNFTPSQTNGIVGTTTNNNANAGSVGEFVTATASAVALTTGTGTNITSISLTAGDWDVVGNIFYLPAATTVIGLVLGCMNTVSATILAGSTGFTTQFVGPNVANVAASAPAPKQRISLSATTTIFLVGQANFTVSTCTASGNIQARRVR